jgi:NAD(P)-dependent dehydrogenase (short-subunit alcohol dehydrogenase family)
LIEERNMPSLTGKNVVVIGGSRGVGRQIVAAAVGHGARVLAVARQQERLTLLAAELPGVQVLALDATSEEAPARVFDVLRPDVLVVSAGVFPPAAPVHELSWQQFSVNWEVDVRIAFNFVKAALSRPLPAGASLILISSGAALAGSPISGGYAGSKRTQMFLASYAQKESDRLRLGLRFTALAPRMMPGTELGRYAVAGYARYLGISEADFVQSMETPPTAADVASAVIEVVTNPGQLTGKVFVVSGTGLQAAA